MRNMRNLKRARKGFSNGYDRKIAFPKSNGLPSNLLLFHGPLLPRFTKSRVTPFYHLLARFGTST